MIGWLFKSKSTQHVKSNLMVFLRPTIINTSGLAQGITKKKFDGIWEFDVSDELGMSSEEALSNMFEGLPIIPEK